MSFPNNILIGPFPPPASGQSISFRMLCEGFEEKKIPRYVIDISGGDIGRKDGAFSFNRLKHLIKPLLMSVMFLIYRKRNIYLTIAQSWNGFLRDFVFIFFASLGNYRIVVHLKGGNYKKFYETQANWKRQLILWTLQKTDSIIVLGKCLIDDFDFVPDYKNKIKVVLNGLPVKTTSNNLPKILSPERPIKLLFLSNLIESKGYLDVLESVNILVNEYNLDIQCDLCGEFLIADDSVLYDNPLKAKEDFNKRILDLGLKNNVHWLGTVSGEKKEKVLAESHFFILPTNYSNEGQPVSIIEALSYGCVVISTHYRTIPDMLEEGKSGIFVDYNNSQQIADSIKSMIDNSDQFTCLSKNAISVFEKKFKRESHLNSIIPIIVNDNKVR